MTGTRQLFVKHSLRCTQQRLAVYESLCRCKSHPTAEELFRLVKPRTERLSLATVYNTLEALSNAGLVLKMPTTTGCCRYDADISEHLHIRFKDSGAIEDVPSELGEKLMKSLPRAVLHEIAEALDLDIEGVNIQLLARRNGRSDCSCARTD